MTLEEFVKVSLWITAPLNFVAGCAFAFPESALGTFIELPQQAHIFYTAFSGAMIALFGAAYFWLALQPAIHRPLLFMGACGKSLTVIISVALFAAGELSDVTTALISGDLAFALLWFYWLFRSNASSDA